MKSTRGAGWFFAGCCLWLLPVQSAQAQESFPQLYVGAGIGSSTIRQNSEANTDDFGLVHGASGWDFVTGVRPLSDLGAEIGYVDFGGAHRYFPAPYYPPNDVPFLHESADAPVAFAVGYLPIEPWWDLYLKAGIADLHKSWNVKAVCPLYLYCPVGFDSPFHWAATDWDFAYGVGTQWKVEAVAFRLEYERVNASGGDPDLLSVGVSWTFF